MAPQKKKNKDQGKPVWQKKAFNKMEDGNEFSFQEEKIGKDD